MSTEFDRPDLTFADFASDGELREQALWPPHLTPAIRTEVNGFVYLETSDWWRGICSVLPCSIWLDWPGYATASYATKIGGKNVVIQCWKGWCQQAPFEVGPIHFPGGIGAEVGVYSLDPPWRQESLAPLDFPLFPINLRNAFRRWIARRFADPNAPENTQLWWPDVDLVAKSQKEVSFTLFDPEYDEPLIADYRTSTYWTCKWMQKASYLEWRKKQPRARELEVTPLLDPDQYVLDFTVDGVAYRWADDGIQLA